MLHLTGFKQPAGEDLTRPILSLAQLLDKGYFKSAYEGGLFTPRSKRALVLNLARCLLCLFGSKWLQREWEAVDLAFLCGAENQAKRLVDMHRPYVLGSLSHTAYCVDFVRRSSSVPHHPAVLSFAKLLVDIERGRRITEEEFQLSDGQHNEWLTISTIVTTKLSGSLTEHYTTAIQSCLDFARMERRQANETDSDYIYRNIVLPLQKELSDYPMSHIENVELQLPVTSPEELGAVPKAIPVGSQAPHSPRSPSQRPLFLSTRIETYRTPDVVFFDDFECGGRDDNASHSKAITDQPLIERSIKERSIKFLKLLDDWMEQRIEKLKVKGTGPVSGSTATATEPCLIKVAILDTGLDRSNATFIKARRYIRSNHSRQDDPVKEVKSFIHEGGEGQDVDGHGTLTTTLILKAAPWANLYVAKIASGRTTGECDAIAKAIEEASDKTKWNVDIIVMPFSVERHSDAVKNALNNAYHRGKILIASAANSGGLSGRAYPAKDERVICMHASDGMGNDSNGTNPSALSRVDNFTTLGLGIEFSQAGKRVWKSGTSYSAPIAAGIAASILHVIGHPANEGEMSPEQLTNDNVRDGYDFIGPWNLWKSTLSESDVCSIIKQQLTR
ncbi:hypothetical protein CSIM01_07529 [Colletotrichum simmondsii]|uniref:Uncharacterized protein n=1 Tax=Colletotrichum simmondsii TaxID=703756 RepID=A0A135SAG3_9PEZI|nr:hypothetical protein CSIM01_07529 [Colletotrichum simmondsii]